ncbi:MAG: SDR family oxidoreductase [Gammaproteobacteria bacterium]|nr:SDR family oxidoreductase [Gammaproteobacteria bacterium]MDH5275755.1 SDR family oxidoreductase [Gammaproteobacteria bacterium]
MLLLTGVTGKTGGASAEALLRKGVPLRAIVRNADKAESLKSAGVELIVGDVADKGVLEKAMTRVGKALMIMPNGERQLELEKQFIDVAKRKGVKHLVKMSSMEAAADAKSPIPKIHYASEQYLQKSGLAWTLIKPNFFMQNFLGSAGTIKEQGKFFLPMGKGKTVMVDTRDIGASVAAVMTGQGHESRKYELTGPEVLSFADAAERFSKVLGRKIEYVHVPMEAYRKTLARFLTNEWHLNAVCELFQEIADGQALSTTDSVQKLTGKPPISFEQFVRDHKAVFTPA